jgi:hypothetical protein
VPDLDRLGALASATSLDVSPRGVSPRPEPELSELLAQLGPGDVDAVRARLDGAEDPAAALVWGGALARIGTPDAEAALDAYAERLRERDPWPGAYPGRREVLLHLGRGD